MKFNNKNIFISTKAKIHEDVKIGDGTVIYDNVEIDKGTIVANNCIIGEPSNSYYKNDSYENRPTYIGKNSLIRSHTIIYEDNVFGDGLITGHRATIREKSRFGKNCLISTLVDIQGNSKFGDYCRIYSNVHICEDSDIGNYTFIYPYTIFTNDGLPPSNEIKGPKIGDFTIIAVHSIILPGVKIGENCLIGANTLVTKNIEDYSFVTGSPGRRICDIRELKDKDGNQHYPWPNSFSRGMPWEGVGFEKWREINGS